MKIAIGSDEKTTLTDFVLTWLKTRGHNVTCYGALQPPHPARWVLVARDVALAVQRGEAEMGILFCWTGTGVSIAANKINGIRAALCNNAEIARGARLWNNANVLCLSLLQMDESQVISILEIWMQTPYQPNSEDDSCLQEITGLEQLGGGREDSKGSPSA